MFYDYFCRDTNLCIQNCVHHMTEQCTHLMGVYFPALICVIASKRLLQIWQECPLSINCKLKSKIIFLILSIQMFQNCLRNASCKCLRSQGQVVPPYQFILQDIFQLICFKVRANRTYRCYSTLALVCCVSSKHLVLCS